MAVLTRPLFHAQERVDLEDFNQLLSGLRTDSKLRTRQFWGSAENYILKGFNASGLGTPQLTVDILDAAMLFSGKQAPSGTSNITLIGNDSLIASNAIIKFTKDDGSTIEFARTTGTAVPSNGTWAVGGDSDATASSIAAAIAGLASEEFVDNGSVSATGSVINMTSSVQGFINIEISPSNGGFQRLTDTVLNIFDYTANPVESPSDLSWWTIQSDATSAQTKLTQGITSQFRATGVVRTIIVYATLLTEEATPITKAFWDPSANSGSGAEFNQRVNTAVDLSIQLNLQDSPLTGDSLFANTEICRIEVDASGNILAIRDTRKLFFEGVDTYDWNRTADFATLTTLTMVPSGITVTTNLINSTEFQVNEPISFFDVSATLPDPSSASGTSNVPQGTITDTSKIVRVDTGATPTMGIEKLNLANIQTYGQVVFGTQSGACRLVSTINSNFVRDDKDLGNLKEWIDAVTTGIRQAKGTENWFDDVDGNVQDALKFINSTIVADDDLAVFQWNPGSGLNATGNLLITTDPQALVDFNFTVQPVAADTIIIGTTTFTAIANTATVGANQFRIGTTLAQAATNFAASAAANTNFTGTANGTNVTVASALRTNFLVTGTYTVSVSRTNAPAIVRELGVTLGNDLVAVRIFNRTPKLFIERADSTTTTSSVPIPAGHVLYLTLPIDADFNSNGAGNGLRYRGTVDFNTARALPNYNSLDPIFGERNNPNADNNYVGMLKTIPIGEFVNDGRNYWIAVSEDVARATDTAILHIRGVGAVNGNESIPVGEGVTNQTLAYIGASGASDSTPAYPSVTSIAAHTTDGAYTVASNFNTTVITQSENLTKAISDLNNHLVTLKDVEYQDKGIKLVDGGFWTWTVGSNKLEISEDAFIQIPGLALNANTIGESAFDAAFDGSTTAKSLLNGEVITATINRTDTGSAQNVSLGKSTIDALTPGRDIFILARRVGNVVYVGISGAMRLADGETSPLDGALSYFGLSGGSGQLPRQLKTVIGTQTSTKNIQVETGDIRFRLGGFAPTDNNANDDFVTLTIPAGSGVLQWEGANFAIPQTGTTITVQNTVVSGGNFRLRTGATEFTLPTIAAGESCWLGISIIAGDAINTSSGDFAFLDTANSGQPGSKNAGNDTFVGRILGEPSITFGNVATQVSDTLTFAEFAGDVPIAQILVTRTGTNLDDIGVDDVVVLGAAGGGGGGGTGNANQDLNNYLNRLNGSTFEYFTPIISAVSTTENIDQNVTNTTAGLSTSGFDINANAALTTTNLIDPEFIAEGLIPERMEIEGIWQTDASDPSQAKVDPNAKWFISFNSMDTLAQFTPITPTRILNVAGWIRGDGTLAGTNLTNTTVVNTIFVENHGFSTGHKITLSTAGNLNLAAASPVAPANTFYVETLNPDSFRLFETLENADDLSSITGLIAVQNTSGTTVGGAQFTIEGGIISRVAISSTSRGIFDVRTRTLTAGATPYSAMGVINANALVRLRVVGDANAGSRNQADDAVLTSLALFYKDQLGIEGVNPNGLDDVNDILRSSHLVNAANANASYGVNGRGVSLLNGAGAVGEIALDSNNDIQIGTAGTFVTPIVTNGATSGQILVADANGNFNPSDLVTGLIAVQEFTTDGTYNVPDDAVALRVIASGGGGGGGGVGAVTSGSNQAGGVGGASGQYGTVYRALTAGTSRTLTVDIGAAGGGGNDVDNNQIGQDGAETSLKGSFVTDTIWGGGPGGSKVDSGGTRPSRGFRPNSTNPNDFSQEGGGASWLEVTAGGELEVQIVGRITGLINRTGNSSQLGGGNGGNNGKATGGIGADGVTATLAVGGAGGGGAGWTNGSAGTTATGSQNSPGGNGGRGGMIIEALGILPT